MWIKVNIKKRVLCELVWRELVQRAFDVEFTLMNKIKDYFLRNFIIKITN